MALPVVERHQRHVASLRRQQVSERDAVETTGDGDDGPTAAEFWFVEATAEIGPSDD